MMEGCVGTKVARIDIDVWLAQKDVHYVLVFWTDCEMKGGLTPVLTRQSTQEGKNAMARR